MNYGYDRPQNPPQNMALDVEALQRALVQIGSIADRLEQRSEQAILQVQESTGRLDQSAQQWSHRGGQFGQQAVQAISQQAQQALMQGLNASVTEVNRQLEKTSQTANFAAGALAEQRHQLTLAQKSLVWKSLIALSLGSLLLAGGSLAIAWNSLREVKKAEFSRDILQATKTGVLVPCGDGALCVKLDANAAKAGRNGEYRVLVD